MKRKRRTTILIDGSRELAHQFSKEIEKNYSIQQLMQPSPALAMVQVREAAQQSLFYLGEVLIAEAKVQVEGHVGIGVVANGDEQFAYELAVIDAVFAAGLPETNKWIELLEQEERHIMQRQLEREAALLKTKVNFEMMDAE